MRKFIIGVGAAVLAAASFLPSSGAVPKKPDLIVKVTPADSGYMGSSGGVNALTTNYASDTDYWQRNFAQAGKTWKVYEWIVNVAATDVTSGYFFSSEFYFKNDTSQTGYSGLQSNMYNPYTGTYTGKGVVFSIWGGSNATAGTGGYTFSGTEGTAYVSVHLPYNWVTGCGYKWDLFNQINGSQQFTGQMDAYVTNTCNSVQTYVGTIHFPSTWGGFYPYTVDFHENYKPYPYAACNQIIHSQAYFYTPLMNNIDGTWYGESAWSQSGWYGLYDPANLGATDCLNGQNLYQGSGQARLTLSPPYT